MVKWTKASTLCRVALVGAYVLTVWYGYPWWTWTVLDSEGNRLEASVATTLAGAKAEALQAVDRLKS